MITINKFKTIIIMYICPMSKFRGRVLSPFGLNLLNLILLI